MLRNRGAVFFAVALMLIAACSGSSPQAPTGTQAASTAPLPTKLTVAFAQEPTSLDNLQVTAATAQVVSGNIIEPLVTIDEKTNQVVANLAESWTQAEPERWRVNLRSGVKFHNGQTMTAKDVVASLQYSLQPNSQLFQQRLGKLKSVQESGPLAIDIVTNGPDPVLPLKLVYVNISPASAVARGTNAMAAEPIGSGPYKFVRWERGNLIVLTRFDDYWGGAAPIRDVEIAFRQLSTVRANMVKAGEAQLASPIAPEDGKSLGLKLVTSPGLEVYAMLVNTSGQTQGSIMTDIRVRRAINYAIDRDTMRNQLFGGFASKSNGNPVPPAVLGFNSELKDYPYDPNMAKKLINEAGAQGKTVTFLCSGGRWPKDGEVCQAVASYLEAVGLKVKLDNPPFQQWLDSFRGGASKTFNRPDLMIAAAGASSLDGAGETANFYLSHDAGGGLYTVEDPALDKVIKDAQSQSDLTRRATLTRQVFQTIWTQAYHVELFVPENVWATSANIQYAPRSDAFVLLKQVRYTSP